MTTHDTIARLVDAYTDSLGAVVSHAVRYSAAQSNEERGHVQRDMHAALEESRQHLHQAFLETLGPGAEASPAPAAEGPWVVKGRLSGGTQEIGYSRGPGRSFSPKLSDAHPYDIKADAEADASNPGAWITTVLPLAEAERVESFRSLADRAGPPPVGALASSEECERKAARQAKPAGWVVRLSNGQLRWLWMRTVASGAEYEPYATREDAQRIADTTGGEAVPVDAAGNVIEAEDIGATLRREECERKAARQSGVAWEAARAGEEAERLRGELAAVRVERDALNAAEADLRHALRAIAGCVGGAVSLGASTEMHCAVADEVRAVVGQLRAERDALAAEVQRAKEQKPVHLALVNEQGAVVDGYLIKTRALAEDDARRRACTVAPLYLAPPLRDVSGVIAQCEEAERLRAELATWKRTAEQRMERIRSVKAERDDRSARCDAAEADVARLTKERDTARAERDTAKAERDKLTTDEADLRYALRTIAGPLHLRTRPRPCRARRGGCGGVSMGYGIDRGFGYSDSMHGSSASDLAEEVMRARQKFPGRRFLLAALTEEVGELAKAYLQREGDEAVRKEALQVACVAMRIYEEGDETFDDVTAAEAKK